MNNGMGELSVHVSKSPDSDKSAPFSLDYSGQELFIFDGSIEED
jgi:hypothetical protein